jgi:hypothetical protein
MNAINPAQSQRIGAEIYSQGCRLDCAADRLADPWGRLQRERLQRIARERFASSGVRYDD